MYILYLVILILVLLTLHVISLLIGFANFACHLRLSQIVLSNLQVAFGSSYVSYCSVELLWVLVTILKLMGWVNAFTDRLSKYYVVIVHINNKNGRPCSRSVNLLSTLLFRMPLLTVRFVWFLVLSLHYHWMLYCPMCSCQRRKTLYQYVSKFSHRSLMLWKLRSDGCRILQTDADAQWSFLLATRCI